MKRTVSRDTAMVVTRFDKRIQPHRATRGAHLSPVAPVACRRCGNVYTDKHWSKPIAPGSLEEKLRTPPLPTTLCLGCRRETQNEPAGYVHLDGSFLREHYGDIKRLVANETERARDNNPLSRIVSWQDESDDTVTVTTTSVHLAQRIGRALANAFNGRVRYGLSNDNRLAHVYWHRTA